MLHELLLALSGFPGGIFIEDKQKGIQVVTDLPFIHANEVSVLNRLCRLGTYNKKFQEFITEYRGTPILFANGKTQEDSSRRLQDGLYLRAFCSGLDKVLENYRQSLLSIEQEILKDAYLSLGYIQHSLEEYQLLFPALSAVVDQILYHKIHGCHILEILHRNAACGLPSLKHALERILYTCHGVMYKQLTAWTLHGLLLDHYAEFFIQQSSEHTQTVPKEDEDDYDLGIGGVTGKQLREAMKLSEESTLSHKPEYVLFALRPQMLPSYIPSRLAEKILFIGESVQVFENQQQRDVLRHTGSVLKEREEEFAMDLSKLQQQPVFCLMSFEAIIDKIRVCVAEHLWSLVMEESDLLANLNVMKDFYLLGRGELFLAFIDHAQGLLKMLPTATTEHDVNAAFRQAARRVLLDDDSILSKFKMTVQSKTVSSKQALKKSEIGVESGWNCLDLVYTVEWPLHILFTQTVLEKYNTMFKFLLHIKKVQLELQHCWAIQMERKNHTSSQLDSNIWHLRRHMAFLVDNLQYYLQVDVLETQFSQLGEKIKSTRDFETIRLSHDRFLTALLGQSFLHMKPVAHCLKEILDICHSFCMLLIQTIKFRDREVGQIDKLAQGFKRQSSLLFTLLSSVRSHESSPYLAQLMLRIDFNKYYSQSGAVLTG
ncbi:gamma-tubulin complex component 4-like [Saccoglossus kowalevskii]|uniref:Gamma-tubulin complex component n=1 Tax=Saccoglossus kowalevskii TaxID=10224 RepID=A0ABM0GVD6_SACKO|nr:PREDICTED: gamma-tubulin complex component 4-like [Saccoglossus kowalevskii]